MALILLLVLLITTFPDKSKQLVKVMPKISVFAFMSIKESIHFHVHKRRYSLCLVELLAAFLFLARLFLYHIQMVYHHVVCSMHALILYVPFLTSVFSTAPLSFGEWVAVLCFSAPVILLDELLKIRSRRIAGTCVCSGQWICHSW